MKIIPSFEITIGGIKEFYEILFLSILGVFAGIIGSIYMKGLTFIFKIPKQIPIFFLPIIAGTICGIFGIFLSRTFRIRYRYDKIL